MADIKMLLAKLDQGWKEKVIFDCEGIDYKYPYHEGKDEQMEIFPGWATVMILLADMLGLTNFGETPATSDYSKTSLRAPYSIYSSQQDVWTLRTMAREFIELMETPPPKKRAKRIKIS